MTIDTIGTAIAIVVIMIVIANIATHEAGVLRDRRRAKAHLPTLENLNLGPTQAMTRALILTRVTNTNATGIGTETEMATDTIVDKPDEPDEPDKREGIKIHIVYSTRLESSI